MRLTAVLLLALSSLVAECGNASAAGKKTLAEQLADGSFLTDPANPVDIAFDPDTDAQTRADIGPDGGTIVVTGADGTKYSLEIPPAALLIETTISMGALTHIQGLPKDSGSVLAVALGPERLVLEAPAVLTVTPGTMTPRTFPFGFASTGEGQDVGLLQRRVAETSVSVLVRHFSTAGVAMATSPGAEQTIAESRQRDIETMFESQIAALFPEIDFSDPGLSEIPVIGTDTPADSYFSLLRLFYETVLPGRIEQASMRGASCEAIETASRMIIRAPRAGSGVPEGWPLTDKLQALRDAAFGKMINNGYIANLDNCIQDKAKRCAYKEGMELYILVDSQLFLKNFSRGIRNINADMRREQVLKIVERITRHCRNYNVDFDSSFTDDNICWKIQMDVAATFTAQYDARRGDVRGNGVQDIRQFSEVVHSGCKGVMHEGFDPRAERPLTLTVDRLNFSKDQPDYVESAEVTLDFGKVVHKHRTMGGIFDIDAWRVPFTQRCFGEPLQVTLTADGKGTLSGEVNERSFVGCPGWETPNNFTIDWRLVLTPIPRPPQ